MYFFLIICMLNKLFISFVCAKNAHNMNLQYFSGLMPPMKPTLDVKYGRLLEQHLLLLLSLSKFK